MRNHSILRGLCFLSLLATSLCASQCVAQALFIELTSPSSQGAGRFGASLAPVVNVGGDNNDTTKTNIVVGAPGETPAESSLRSGVAYLFDGITSEVLLTLLSPNAANQGQFGASVAGLGDVNGDGIGEVIVGAYLEDTGATAIDVGRAYVFDGSTGAVMHTLVCPFMNGGEWFGSAVSGVPDVNGDGLPDVVVGAQGDEVRDGRVYLYDGASGELLRTLIPYMEKVTGLFGYSVAGIEDMNGDGRGDVLIGAPGEDSSSGRAYVYDASTGNRLQTLTSPDKQDQGFFGGSVSGIPSIAGTGGGKVVVGASLESYDEGPVRSGRAYIFDAASGDLLCTLVSPNQMAGGRLGNSVSGTADLDYDGHGDVIVGAYGESSDSSPSNAGRTYIFNGLTGQCIQTLISPREEGLGYFGTAVCALPDVDGDGRADAAVTEMTRDPQTQFYNAGRAYMIFSTWSVPPNTPTVEIVPANPKTADDLVCLATGSVGFEGRPIAYRYQWFLDEERQQDESDFTIWHEKTARGQLWECVVTPNDGEQDGRSASAEVIIENSLPSAPAIEIIPENPTPQEGLAVILNQLSVDDDGDDIVYLFEWYESPDGVNWTKRPEISGNLSPFFPGLPEISPLYRTFVQAGENWRVDVTPIEAFSVAKLLKHNMDNKTEPVLGPTVSARIVILTNLVSHGIDGVPERIDPADLALLIEVWHLRKDQLQNPIKGYFFGGNDPADSQVGVRHLLSLGPMGWYRTVGR